jgi:RNA polymerase sigma factor (sigma-70 family)
LNKAALCTTKAACCVLYPSFPAQPVERSRPPKGPEWLHEVKWDGYRCQLNKVGDRVIVSSRNGKQFTGRFASVWEALRSLPAKSAIIDAQALSIVRDEQRVHAADDLDTRDLPQLEAALSRLPEASALRRCLEQLDADRRAAVVLAYAHGFSHGELAGRLGVPLGTVKSWVRRALLSLQECMG